MVDDPAGSGMGKFCHLLSSIQRGGYWYPSSSVVVDPGRGEGEGIWCGGKFRPLWSKIRRGGYG